MSWKDAWQRPGHPGMPPPQPSHRAALLRPRPCRPPPRPAPRESQRGHTGALSNRNRATFEAHRGFKSLVCTFKKGKKIGFKTEVNFNNIFQLTQNIQNITSNYESHSGDILHCFVFPAKSRKASMHFTESPRATPPGLKDTSGEWRHPRR